jgi:malonyl CoA-acyl carrier protein transacylase
MFKAQNIDIQFVAGHSLGEYSACIAANGLTFEEGLELVKQRAEFMSKCGQGSMLACIGPDIANIVGDLIVDFNELYLANYNSNQQIVVSGNTDQINELIVACKSKGIKCIKLNVAAAFHSPFMLEANQLMNPLIFQANFADIECGFISNKTSQILRSKAELQTEFEDQIILPVNWSSMCETIAALVEQEGLAVYEVGNTLGKLLQQQTGIKSISVEEVIKVQ